MSKLSSYNGSVQLISGITQKNTGDFPLVEAHDILVDDGDVRLDAKLDDIVSSVRVLEEYILSGQAEGGGFIIPKNLTLDGGNATDESNTESDTSTDKNNSK
jgi:hypothetical protein